MFLFWLLNSPGVSNVLWDWRVCDYQARSFAAGFDHVPHTPPRVISLLPGSKRNRAGLLEFHFQGTERARIVQVAEMLIIHSGRLAVGRWWPRGFSVCGWLKVRIETTLTASGRD